jgi:hypothetical protein
VGCALSLRVSGSWKLFEQWFDLAEIDSVGIVKDIERVENTDSSR